MSIVTPSEEVASLNRGISSKLLNPLPTTTQVVQGRHKRVTDVRFLFVDRLRRYLSPKVPENTTILEKFKKRWTSLEGTNEFDAQKVWDSVFPFPNDLVKKWYEDCKGHFKSQTGIIWIQKSQLFNCKESDIQEMSKHTKEYVQRLQRQIEYITTFIESEYGDTMTIDLQKIWMEKHGTYLGSRDSEGFEQSVASDPNSGKSSKETVQSNGTDFSGISQHKDAPLQKRMITIKSKDEETENRSIDGIGSKVGDEWKKMKRTKLKNGNSYPLSVFDHGSSSYLNSNGNNSTVATKGIFNNLSNFMIIPTIPIFDLSEVAEDRRVAYEKQELKKLEEIIAVMVNWQNESRTQQDGLVETESTGSKKTDWSSSHRSFVEDQLGLLHKEVDSKIETLYIEKTKIWVLSVQETHQIAKILEEYIRSGGLPRTFTQLSKSLTDHRSAIIDLTLSINSLVNVKNMICTALVYSRSLDPSASLTGLPPDQVHIGSIPENLKEFQQRFIHRNTISQSEPVQSGTKRSINEISQ